MKGRALTLSSLTMLVLCAAPSNGYSQQNITVTTSPACTGLTTSGTGPSLTLIPASGTATCGNYELKPNSTSSARIDLGNDSAQDLMQLSNLKITKIAAGGSDFQMTFSADNFNTLPDDFSAGSGEFIFYKANITATFRRGANPSTIAKDDKMGYSGYTKIPQTNATWDPLGSNNCFSDSPMQQYCYTVANNNDVPSSNVVKKQYTELSSPRSLKGELRVKLRDPSGATTDSLLVTALPVSDSPGGHGKPGKKPPKSRQSSSNKGK